MQPYLFPYIGYWQLIHAVDTFVIFDDVNYIKKGYINRNSILVNGSPHLFTLSLIGASQNKHINEITVGNTSVKLLKTLEMTYKKSPYFSSIYPLIEQIVLNDEKNLAKFIYKSFETIAHYLGINTKFIFSSDIKKNNRLKAEDKIIEICEIMGAKTYINPVGGKELYRKEHFHLHNINLYFLNSEPIKYRQFEYEFVPYLSIIDILMFNSKSEIQDMLERYTLE